MTDDVAAVEMPHLQEMPTTRWADVLPVFFRVHAPLSSDAEVLDEISQAPWARLDRDRADSVLDAITQEFAHVPWGELFPTINLSAQLRRLGLANRAVNALGRRNLDTFGDVRGITSADFSGFSAVGAGTTRETLESLIVAQADAHLRSLVPEGAPSSGASKEQGPSLELLRALELVELLSRYWQLVGQPTVTPLAASQVTESLPSVTRILEELQSLTAEELFPLSDGQPSVADALEDALQRHDEREREILRRRVLADSGETLESIASDYGVTRERIRQLEAKTASKFTQAALASPVLKLVASSLSETVTHVMGVQALVDRFPSISEVVPSLGEPVWRVLDRLDESYEIRDGWAAAPNVRSAVAETTKAIREWDSEVIPVTEFEEQLGQQWLTQRRSNLEQWLAYCGYMVFEDHILPRTANILVKAESMLRRDGEPLTAEQIHSRLGEERSLQGLRNRLAESPRFGRVGVAQWSLAEWGMEEYTSIRGAITDVLDTNGGSAPLGAIADDISARFGVKRHSVLAYAMAYPFVSRNGVVSKADQQTYGVRDPATARGVYHRGDDWLFRVTINGEHLRGSGTLMPVGFATAIDLRQGESFQKLGPEGSVTFTWVGMQPAFGSVKRTLEHHRIEAEEEVFFVALPGGRFDIERVAATSTTPLADLLAAVGALHHLQGREALDAICDAIGLPGDREPERLQGWLAARREYELAELIDEIEWN